MTASTDSTEPAAGQELLSERVAGGVLPRVLTTFDMVAIFVAIVLFITNAAVIQSAGPAAFGWWIIAFVVFLIPCAIVTGQLGAMFPGEGSIYLWTHKAFGPFWGFFAGFCAWWPGVLVMVATGTLTMSFLGFAFPGTLGDLSIQWQGAVIVGILIIAALLAAMRFRLTQNVVNVVFVLYGLAILAMFAAGFAYLARGHSAATNPGDFGTWAPGNDHGINFANWSFFGLAVLALLGVEVPLNMGVEIKEERAVTRYLLWGSVVVVVAYLLATWGVMVTVPGKDSAGITAVAAAVGIGIASWLGKAVALILAAMFFIITVVYNYSFARLIFVSGLDRRLPAVMSHVNKAKVPDVAVWVQTVIAGLFTLIAFIIVPAAASRPAADVQTQVYDVLQAAVTVIWCLSIIVLFVDVLIILRRYRTRFLARRLAHPAVFWVASIVGALASLVGVVATLSGSWTPLISNDAGSVKFLGAEISYGAWFWWVGGIALVSLVVGALLYVVGARTARRPAAGVPAEGAAGS
ncbi:MAG TPA: APC family permease [Streptosporangiaceae bacterium]|jgi:amino acid transporter